MPLPQAFIDRIGVPVIDETNLDAVLGAQGENKRFLVLFAGDPAQRPEAADVAVIFPELLRAFGGRLSGALAAAAAEKSLGQRFHVDVLPSLAVIRGGATIGVIPRIRDWAEYLEKIEAFLDPTAEPMAKAASRVQITFSQKGATA
jgi:hydrogenase-1 operon protein HyaE